MTDAELDARFAALRDVEPPAALADATLAEWRRLRDEEAKVVPLRRPRWPWIAGALALAAGLLFAVRATSPEVGDPAALVPRGTAEVAPRVELDAVVRTATGFVRHDPARAWSAGDTLRFRVHASAPLEVTLRRDQAVLWRGTVPAGDTELPVGWAFEPGEGPSVFRLDAGDATAELRVAGVAP